MYHLKKIIKTTLRKTVAREPILKRWRLTRLYNSVVLLMYHELAEDDHEIEAWTVVKKTDFTLQMEYLSEKFSVISLGEAFQNFDKSHITEKPAVVITFDDGYSGNKRILLPLVKTMNIPVTIFIATRAVQEQIVYWYDKLINVFQGKPALNISLKHVRLGDYRINRTKGPDNWSEINRLLSDLKTLRPSLRENIVEDIIKNIQVSVITNHSAMAPLTIADVRELAECPLITIGAHSHCHNLLAQLADADVRESILTSRNLLELWTGRPVSYLSYPNGNYNKSVVESVKHCGFKCGMTTEARPWRRGDSCFTIPRIGIGRYDSSDQFKIRVSGGLI